MRVLAIETSTPRGSVAVLEESGLVHEEHFTAERSHSSALFACLDRVCARQRDVHRIVVGLGPGSYAGVRIAISAALGLSLTRGAELVGIPSIAALVEDTTYVAIGDARRETFYWSCVEKGICTEGPEIIDLATLQERLPKTTHPVFSSDPLPEAQLRYPSAVILARLAQDENAITARHDLEPLYLRAPHITQPRQAPGKK